MTFGRCRSYRSRKLKWRRWVLSNQKSWDCITVFDGLTRALSGSVQTEPCRHIFRLLVIRSQIYWTRRSISEGGVKIKFTHLWCSSLCLDGSLEWLCVQRAHHSTDVPWLFLVQTRHIEFILIHTLINLFKFIVLTSPRAGIISRMKTSCWQRSFSSPFSWLKTRQMGRYHENLVETWATWCGLVMTSLLELDSFLKQGWHLEGAAVTEAESWSGGAECCQIRKVETVSLYLPVWHVLFLVLCKQNLAGASSDCSW